MSTENLLQLGIDTGPAQRSLNELLLMAERVDKTLAGKQGSRAKALTSEYDRIKRGISDVTSELAKLERARGVSDTSTRKYLNTFRELQTRMAQYRSEMGGLVKLTDQLQDRTLNTHKIMLRSAVMKGAEVIRVAKDEARVQQGMLDNMYAARTRYIKNSQAQDLASYRLRTEAAKAAAAAQMKGDALNLAGQRQSEWKAVVQAERLGMLNVEGERQQHLKRLTAQAKGDALNLAGQRQSEWKAVVQAERLGMLNVEGERQQHLKRLRTLESEAAKQQTLSSRYVAAPATTQINQQMAARRLLDANMDPSKLYAAEAVAAARAASSIGALQAAKDGLTGATRRAGAATSESVGHMERWSKAAYQQHALARGLAGSLGQLWMTYGSLAPLLAGAAIGAAVKGVMTLGSEFEYQLTFVRALGGESEAAMLRLSAAAKALAKDGLYGPSEVANGLRILAQAGLKAGEAIQALPHVLNLATVGEMQMGDAAVTLIGVMNAFKLQVGDIGHIGDIFAKAAAVSQISVTDMTEAMKAASVVGTQYNVSLEDTATALVVLGQVNIRGTAAGTAFRNMVKELYSPTNEAAKMIKQLGLETATAEGALRPFPAIIYDLRGKLEQFDKISQTHILQRMFGERGAKEAIAMLAKTKDQWDELEGKIKGSSGFMRKVSAELEATTRGTMTQAFNTLKVTMVDAFESTGGKVGELAGAMKLAFGSTEMHDAIQGLASAALSLGNAFVTTLPILTALAQGLGTLAPLLVVGAELWVGYRVALLAFGAATKVVGLIGLTSAMQAFIPVALGAASALTGGTGLIAALRMVTLALNPWVAGAAAIAGVGYALYKLIDVPTDALGTRLDTLGDKIDRIADRAARLNKAATQGLVDAGYIPDPEKEKAKGEVANMDLEIARRKFFLKQSAGLSGMFVMSESSELGRLERQRAKQVAKLQGAEGDERQASLKTAWQKFMDDNKADANLSAMKSGGQNLAANEILAGWKKNQDPMQAEIDATTAQFNEIKKVYGSTSKEFAAAKVAYDAEINRIRSAKKYNPKDPHASDELRAQFEAAKNESQKFVQDFSTIQSELENLLARGAISFETFGAATKTAVTGQYDAAIQALEASKAQFGGNKTMLEQINGQVQGLLAKRNQLVSDADTELITARRRLADDMEKIEIESGIRQLDAADRYGREWLEKNKKTYDEVIVQLNEGSDEAVEAMKRLLTALGKGQTLAAFEETLKGMTHATERFKSDLETAMGEDAEYGLFGAIFFGRANNINAAKSLYVDSLRMQLAAIQRVLNDPSSVGLNAEGIVRYEAERSNLERAIKDGLKATDPDIKQFSDTLGNYVAEGLVYGFDQGETPAKMFANMLKQELVKSISAALSNDFNLLINMMLGGGGAVGGQAGAAGGGGALGMAQNGLSLYRMYQGGNLSANSLVGNYISGAGNTFGSYGMSSFGTGMTLTTDQASAAADAYMSAGYTNEANSLISGSQAGGLANSAGSYIAYASAIYAASQGQYGQAVGTAIGSYWGPIGAMIGSYLGGMVDEATGPSYHSGAATWTGTDDTQKLLTHDAKVGDTRVWGGFSETDAEGGRVYAEPLKRFSMDVSNNLEATLKQFGLDQDLSVYSAFGADGEDKSRGSLRIYDESGNLLGANSDQLLRGKKYDDDPKKGFDQFTADAAGAMRDVLVAADLPAWVDAVLETIGETPSMDSLNTVLKQIQDVKDMAALAGPALGLTSEGLAGVITASGDFAGTMQAIGAIAATTVDANERFRMAQTELQKQFNLLGVSMPQSTESFRAMLRGIDLTAEAGQTLYANLLDLAPAFWGLATAVESVFAEISKATAMTAESFAMDIMSNEEKYAVYDARIDKTLTDLEAAIDPTLVKQLFDTGMADLTSAWNLLDEAEKKRLLPDFQNEAYDLEAAAQARLTVAPIDSPDTFPEKQARVEEAAAKSADQMREAVTKAISDALTAVADRMVEAGMNQAQAAQALRDSVSSLPDRIVLEVAAGYEVGMG